MSSQLELLRELAGADEGKRAALATLDALLACTAELRARADGVSAVLTAAPAERERLARELAEAEGLAETRAASLREAETELADAERRRDRERLLAARRLEVRARDALATAERQLASAREAHEAHERALVSAEADAPRVEAEAGRLAHELGAAPRVPAQAAEPPEPGLAGVQAWTTSARAALVVARSGVASERETLIRQANELASVLLGEPQVATSAALVAERVERTVGAGAARPAPG